MSKGVSRRICVQFPVLLDIDQNLERFRSGEEFNCSGKLCNWRFISSFGIDLTISDRFTTFYRNCIVMDVDCGFLCHFASLEMGVNLILAPLRCFKQFN